MQVLSKVQYIYIHQYNLKGNLLLLIGTHADKEVQIKQHNGIMSDSKQARYDPGIF